MKSPASLPQFVGISRGKKDHPETFIEWPFFVILTLVFVFLYAQSLYSNAGLREPLRWTIFSLLMVAHLLLHWLCVRLQKWARVAVYVVVQCILVFVIAGMSASVAMILGLYIGLIGELIGLLQEKPRWRVAVIAALLGLSFLNYILLVERPGWYWWLLAMLPMTFFVAVYVTLYSRQSEARRQAQTLLGELESANRQLTEYAARVEDLTIAEERQRMARELHDTLSQGLAGLILQLEAVDAHLSGSRLERARSILEQSMQTARETLSEARQAIDNLRQPSDQNLTEAVRHEAERFTRSAGIACEPQIDIRLEVPQLAAEAAIRAITEALTNIVRHARASQVSLRLTGLEESLEIEICDDGVGFDPEAIQAGHYGLLGMRERVRLAGGSFDVRSKPGKGTRITISFPLEQGPHA
jgi:two-component system, NarL family, sensor histidine kinase YdfH